MISDGDLKALQAFWMQERAHLGDPYRDADYAGYLDDKAREQMPALLDELSRLRVIIAKQAVTIAMDQHLHQLDANVVEALKTMTARAEQAEARATALQEHLDRGQEETWTRATRNIDAMAEVQRLSARCEELEIALRCKK